MMKPLNLEENRTHLKPFTYTLFFLLSINVSAQITDLQKKTIDSLKEVIKNSSNDTVKVKAYKTWDDIIYISDVDQDEQLNRKIVGIAEINLKKNDLTVAEKYAYKKALVSALNALAIVSMSQGNFNNSLNFHEKSLKLGTVLNDKKAMSNSLNNIGAIYELKGDYPKAIDYYTRSLKIREEMNDDVSVALILNNIGAIYNDIGDFNKAMEYHMRSLKIRKAKGDKAGIAMSLGNIGIVYHLQKKLDEAIDYFKQGLEIQKGLGDKQAIALSLNNIGAVYEQKKEYDKAMDYYNESLKNLENIEYSQGIAMALNNIGNIYFNQGNYEKAFEYNNKAFIAAKKAGSGQIIKEAANSLFKIFNKKGRYKDALEMHELYISMKDSIESEKNQKDVMKKEMQYNYEKQKAVDEKDHEKKIAISVEQEKKQKVISYSVAFGLIMVLIFAVFIFTRLRLTAKQKGLIEQQKGLVEEKQKEILSSISYAKRLQEAILPPDNFVKEHLPRSFIFYKPKDIVAGDFYWLENKNDTIFIAAADCTGHGVPGAMVSVVCSNALNRAVLEFGITEPGKILDKTRELVLETFSRSDKDVKDGMDISLCTIHKKTNEVKWAGANNPLWYINNGEMEEIIATKQSIGKTQDPSPFKTHNIQLKTGDSLFLFTDGYADQFGSEKGKKFKYKPLQELLFRNSNLSSSLQKEKLEFTFKEWKRNLEQIDDVCIIGIQL